MNFAQREYLPNPEKRIENLQKVINGRQVAILAAGPSIKELEKRIDNIRSADICYIGFNNFWIPEKYILQQIDRHLSVILVSNDQDISYNMGQGHITNFLDREENNMLISTFWGNSLRSFTDKFLNKYDKKLISIGLSRDKTVPNSNYPLHFVPTNTLLGLIQIIIIGKPSMIILFGADGYSSVDECYYHQNENRCSPRDVLISDCNQFNSVAHILIENTYNTHGIKHIYVLNCSENSFYTPFPKISYDDAFKYLHDDKFLKNLRM